MILGNSCLLLLIDLQGHGRYLHLAHGQKIRNRKYKDPREPTNKAIIPSLNDDSGLDLSSVPIVCNLKLGVCGFVVCIYASMYTCKYTQLTQKDAPAKQIV
jgi:hypothetical protein